MATTMYELKPLFYDDLKKIVKLPKFQRSIVWSSEMRREFITTIRKGYPFGSILLYEINEQYYKYQLIDGLQRFSTIMDYEKNKYQYIELGSFAEKEFSKIFEIIEKFSGGMYLQESMKLKIISIISDAFNKQSENETVQTSAIKKLITQYSVLNKPEIIIEITEVISRIDQNIKKEIDLSTLSIPVVIFRGEKSDLPNIFDKINSNGTKLSKYEIFASVWSHYTYSIDDKEILEWVDKKYETMIEKSGITITEYFPGSIIESKEINLFEYAYAVGKIIRDKCHEIFVENGTDISQIDSIGFALISVCVGGSLKQMEKLPEILNDSSPDGLINLKNKLIECSRKVNEILKNYIVSIDGKTYTKYLEAQIVSIIATLFKIRYTVNPGLTISINENSKKNFDKFEKNMPKHYLYDILKGYWAGSGDSKVMDLIKLDICDNKYLQPIQELNWLTVVGEWMEEQESRPSKNVNIIQKLFLNYMNRLSIPQTLYKTYPFDVEHIVPYNRLEKRLKEGPFSAIGNLCFLPSFENRSKKDKTLYEQVDEQTILFNLEQDQLEKFYYADRGELDFIKNDSFTKTEYQWFLKDRHNYLTKKFIELIRK